jgi:hypothetical protein
MPLAVVDEAADGAVKEPEVWAAATVPSKHKHKTIVSDRGKNAEDWNGKGVLGNALPINGLPLSRVHVGRYPTWSGARLNGANGAE